jgi:Rrf2 family transcriptional regulator, iron-sulfur cluster assembly transcription factor
MKLGTKAQYAVMAMADLAFCASQGPVRLTEIAQRQALPLAYLEQLFVKLRKKGLVKSARGYQGGYILAHTPDQLKISDIIQAVEEKIKTTRCSIKSEVRCQGKSTKCLTHDLWAGLEANIEHYFRSVTLHDLCVPHPGSFLAVSSVSSVPFASPCVAERGHS